MNWIDKVKLHFFHLHMMVPLFGDELKLDVGCLVKDFPNFHIRIQIDHNYKEKERKFKRMECRIARLLYFTLKEISWSAHVINVSVSGKQIYSQPAPNLPTKHNTTLNACLCTVIYIRFNKWFTYDSTKLHVPDITNCRSKYHLGTQKPPCSWKGAKTNIQSSWRKGLILWHRREQAITSSQTLKQQTIAFHHQRVHKSKTTIQILKPRNTQHSKLIG